MFIVICVFASCKTTSSTTAKKPSLHASGDTLFPYAKNTFDSTYTAINPIVYANNIEVFAVTDIVYSDLGQTPTFEKGAVILNRGNYRIPAMTPGILMPELSRDSLFVLNFEFDGQQHLVPIIYGDASSILAHTTCEGGTCFSVNNKTYVLSQGESVEFFFVMKFNEMPTQIARGYTVEQAKKRQSAMSTKAEASSPPTHSDKSPAPPQATKKPVASKLPPGARKQ